tara:strand:- start:246 stop:959 length:714 start_codon:yes stop_codon:yes gene_type:complete
MAEIRVKETGTIKLFESDNTSSVTIASPASLGADRTITLPDADVTLVSGTMSTGFAVTDITGQTALGATPADTDEFVLSDAGVLKRVDYSYLKSANTPAFQAKLSANQNPTDLTWTVVGCNTEVFDTDGCYDNTTYRFTPTTAGKYYVYWALTADISVVPSLKTLNTAIGKNGTRQDYTYLTNNDNNWINMTYAGSTVIDMDGSSDYIDLWGYIDVSSGNSYFYAGSYFGAYLLIGA